MREAWIIDFFIFLFSSSCLSVTIILSDNTVRNIKVTPKAVEVKIYQKLSVQRNYPFNEIYSTTDIHFIGTELDLEMNQRNCPKSSKLINMKQTRREAPDRSK